jgi:ABC-2 type transport system permease protein
LSGYVFPVESMPQVFRYLSNAVPTTWMIDASRGVILRGATLSELGGHAIVLWIMAFVMMFISTISFKKRLT